MQQILLGGGNASLPLMPSGLEAVGVDSLRLDDSAAICFNNVWIQNDAHFRPCFLPVLTAIPAVIAAVILLAQILRLLIPWRWNWTKRFVEETVEPGLEIDLVSKRRWTAHTKFLLALSATGSVIDLAKALLQQPHARVFFPVVSWAVVVGQLIIYRPRTAPFAVLSITGVQSVCRILVLSNGPWHSDTQHVLDVCMMITSLLVLVVFVFMPFRDPFLPSNAISKPFSEPTSLLRSPEEVLTVWQFMTVTWVSPLMAVASRRQLDETDVWALPLEFQHTFLHERFRLLKGTVIRRLLSANAIDLCIITMIGILEQLLVYAAPVLLQLLLQAMEEPGVPQRVPLTYALLTLVSRLVATQVGIFSLWFGRRCYERSRGEMITMLYEKTLDRKISSQDTPPEEKSANGNTTNGSADGVAADGTSDEGDTKPKITLWTKISTGLRFLFARSESKPKQRASMGKILNLMRNDVYEVAQRFWEFDALIRVPLSSILSVTLVVNYLGWSSLLGVSVVLAAQIINAILARVLVLVEKKRRAATDDKLQVTSQFVEAIRHLRWYGWQGAWLADIMTARRKELRLRVISSLLSVFIGMINSLSLDLAPVMALFAYTVISRKPLSVDIAFPALQLFSMLTANLRTVPSLIMTLINAWVAVGRIESFMAEPDREEKATEALVGERVSLERATFAWPGTPEPVLIEVDATFPVGLSVICGEVASGKSALLQALLGELDMTSGRVFMPSEPVGYCAQSPWLQSMSIRENILFSAPYDDARYKAVLDACELTPDLAGFKAGDLSLIGENGIGLSGGQRARVALARAVYSKANILLLDDPLSALDQQTAEAIVTKCMLGPLLKGRTVILVTHRTDLVVQHAVQTFKLDAGRASLIPREDATAAADGKSPSHATAGTQLASTTTTDPEQQEAQDATTLAAAVPDKFIEDEHREHGGIKATVYWQYIRAGNLWLWAFLIVSLVFYRILSLSEAWFIKTFAEAYQNSPRASVMSFLDGVPVHPTGILDNFPPPEVDPKPWLLVLLCIALGQSLAYILSQSTTVFVVYTAGRNMFVEVMERVANATFRFYDTTPVGRLMNRMTSDISVIDGGICYQFQALSTMTISWLFSISVVATVTPTFLVFTTLLAILFVLIFRRFIPTSQSLRRLEMVSLTPLMSNFGALLEGLATVRAFRAQARFQQRVIEVVDTFQRMDHFFWTAQAWIQYRYDILAGLANFLLFVLAVVTGLSPGLTAFVLLSANKFISTTHNLCRQYGQLQMQFVSVERVVELVHLEQEPKGTIQPPAWWPSFSGDIVFDNATLQYAPHLPPALQDLSFTIRGGSKTAIIGRTGSGKSTLALSLLATLLPSAGSITIDSLPLAEIDKQALRTKITFLAQDPVLFPGSLRDNLDPLHQASEDECTRVLARVAPKQPWTLDTRIEPAGRNLSQGQRQLVGLARAVLRRSPIIILDEATASIDRDTADQIQRVMHEDLCESTVITIAHRLEAVRNADYCVVLAKGKVVEHGPAAEMLRDRREEVLGNVDEVDEVEDEQ